MKFLFDFFPLLLFLVALKMYDIFVATGVAIAASIVQNIAYWWRHRRLEKMHVVTLVIIVILGGLTLALRDDTFIKWKPTVVYWLFAAIMLITHLRNSKSAMEHMLGSQITLPPHVWSRHNLEWIIFFIVIGILNLYVAFYFLPTYYADLGEKKITEYWAYFKVFGVTALMLIMIIYQVFRMVPYMEDAEQDHDKDNTEKP